MPRWLKIMLVALATIVVTGVLVTFLFVQIFTGIFRGFFDGFTGGGSAEAGPQEVRFLEVEGFDPTSPSAAVVLHPAISGLADPVVVTNPDLLRAASGEAYFTDDSRAETRMVLLSILFLSPPGNGTRATMVSLFQDGREVATLTCFTAMCPRAGPPMAPFDLAGLDADATPVSYDVETVIGADTARALEADLLSRPGHLLVYGLDELTEQAAAFDGYVTLDLPSTFGPWQEETTYNGTEEDAAFQQALQEFRNALPFDTGLDLNFLRSGHNSYEVIDQETGHMASDVSGYGVTDGWLPHMRPSARIWVAEENASTLREAIMAADWPAPNPPPEDAFLAARLPDLIAANGLAGSPEEYQHRATIYDMREELSVSNFTEPEVAFGYYRPVE